MPRFSIITPTYNTPPAVLESMLSSVREQTFGDWELCLVDDASPQGHVRDILRKAAGQDRRIRFTCRTENGGIVAASNDALAMATGDFVALLDHDDELHPDALRLVDEAISQEPEADYVYTDEDKIDEAGRHKFPFYKPDWSPERFRTQMYTCHLSVLRRALVDEVGGFRADVEGSQDWDLVLRVTEQARKVLHVPQVLYHWRMLESSTAARGVEAKPYAYDAGQRALQEHCERIGLPATVEHDQVRSDVYHVNPVLQERPLVSIVIPTAGTSREVRGGETTVLITHCVRSIVTQTTYPNYEIVCVADTSMTDQVREELRAIAGSRLKLLPYDQPFNFSDKINSGALVSDGEHLLMLNDDMEIVTPEWLDRLVMYSGFPGIGAVGAKLLFADTRLQHLGVTFRQARPGHLYRGFRPDYDGYFSAVHVAANYLAVTGACLMTKRAVFEEVGGLSTLFPVNFNDIDYCLKVRAVGNRVVYDPDTVLFHFESSSRSPEVAEWELVRLQSRWRSATWQDPYDNPNLHPDTPHLIAPVYLEDGRTLV